MYKIISLIIITPFLISSTLLSQSTDYFQQDVSYKIDVTLNVEQKTYQGTEIVTYKNNSSQVLEFIWFHFYPNAYKDHSTCFAREMRSYRDSEFHFSKESERGFLNLTSAEIEGVELTWEYKKNNIDEIKIFLAEPLHPGEQVTLDLSFEGKFPKVFSRMGHLKDSFFAATQWYPKVVVYDKFGWHPDSYMNLGEFYGEFGDFDVSITLPKNFVIDATGMLDNNPEEEKFIRDIVEKTREYVQLENKKERKKFIKEWNKKAKNETDLTATKTVRFIARNVHDFAWFADQNYMIYQHIHNDSVLTNVLVSPGNAYDWRDVTKYVEQTVAFYSKEVGAYQYPKASVVDGRLGLMGGMEYPMITNINMPGIPFLNLLETVVMHEVGHNWFYGMLGSNERKETFLDEGLNTFFESRYMMHYHGFNNITKFDSLFKWNWFEDIGEWHYTHIAYSLPLVKQTDQPMNLRSEKYTMMNHLLHYHKGSSMLYALEWLIGAETFKKGIQTYFDTWAGKHPTVDNFFDVMEQISAKNLDWFFDEWYTKTTYNDFTIQKKKTRKTENGFETTVYVKNKGTMKNMPAPVNLVTISGDTLEGRWTGEPGQPVVIKHSSPAKHIEVNLNRDVFESNYLNNTIFLPKIDINFLAQIPRFDTYPINIYPYYWYDEFEDKHRLGVGFWSGNNVMKLYTANGSLYYATDSHKLGFRFNNSHRFLGLFLNYSDVSFHIKDQAGLKNAGLNLTTTYIKRSDDSFNLDLGFGFDKTDLYTLDYVDFKIFETYKYSIFSAYVKFNKNSLLHRFSTQFDIEKTVDIFNSRADYLKLAFLSKYRYRISKNIYTRFRFFSSVVWGDDIPNQELVYLGGDIDPGHRQFVFERRGAMAPLRNWTYDSGMNMLGYARINGIYPADKAGISMTYEFEYDRFMLPVFFLSGAALSNSYKNMTANDIVTEVGVKYDLAFVTFMIPFYISDPAAGEDNFDFRFFMNINFVK